MRRKAGFAVSVLMLLAFGAQTQNRTIDWSVRILSPDSGYLFESPGSDKVTFSLTNLGPDTIYPFDYHYTRMLLGASYFDPMITEAFTQSMYPGDSITLTYEFDLNFSLSKNNVPLCVSSRLVTTHQRDILKEEDGHGDWSNNEHCLRVDHKVKTTISADSVPQSDIDINVYPNPVHSRLYVQSTSKEEMEISIFDLQGRVQLYSNASDRFVDVSSLQAGMYIVRAIIDGNVIEKRIVKY